MKPILIFLLIISFFCSGRTKYDKHDPLISEAIALRKSKNCKQAIQKYQKALEVLISNSSTPFFNLTECALNLNDFTLTNEWIRKGVSVGGATKSYLESYKGFTKIKDKPFYKK